MIGKGTQRTIPLDLLGAIAGALDAAGNAPKTLATVRELIGQDEHPTHQGANTMTTITIEREILERVLECLVQEGRSLRAAEVREALEKKAEPPGAIAQDLQKIADFGQDQELAAQPAPAAVPLGWKLVPLEPFPSQRIAGAVALMKASDSDLDCTTDEIAAAYRAMIAAAGDKP